MVSCMRSVVRAQHRGSNPSSAATDTYVWIAVLFRANTAERLVREASSMITMIINITIS